MKRLGLGVSDFDRTTTFDLLKSQPPSHVILYEKTLNLKTISQGDFGRFRENNLIILSKVANIALRDCF